MKTFIALIAIALGITLGLGLVYALYRSESARLIFMFVFGATFFGATVLLTVLAVNRQWTKSLPDHRITHNHRYQITGQPNQPAVYPANHHPDLLPPPPAAYQWPNGQNSNIDIDDEIVA